MEIGIEVMVSQLKELGYSPKTTETQFVIFEFVVPLGRFRGMEIEIALQAPQFPLVPPSGPYIKPHLMPISGSGGQHPTGGIHRWNKPTPDFQYWSRPFNNWNNSQKNMRDYIAFIRRLFDFE